MPTNSSYDPANNQIKLTIEFPDALLDYDKRFKQKLPGALRRMAMEGKSFWKTLAGQKLKSSRLAYQKAIDIQAMDDTTFQLKLEGFLPYSVETGGRAFDMKPGLLGGRPYRVIPLNVKRYINMQKPTTFATVSINSKASSWMHPGWRRPVKLAEEVMQELENNIIPKHLQKLFKDLETKT